MDTLLLRGAGLALLVAVAVAIGLWRRHQDGRARPVPAGDLLTAEHLGGPLGPVATLVQFSSAVCAPCRAAHRVLSAVASRSHGVRHVELDAEQHLDLVRRLDVMRTPTVLVLDDAGRVVARSSGVPSPAQVTQALALASAAGSGQELS
jgi:thiol-disulfide isomerase/thioredoxin